VKKKLKKKYKELLRCTADAASVCAAAAGASAARQRRTADFFQFFLTHEKKKELRRCALLEKSASCPALQQHARVQRVSARNLKR
jgi:hypothetical protein